MGLLHKMSLVLPYYDNPEMLGIQYDAIRDLPDDVKANLELIVIDDGSPTWPAMRPAMELGIPFRLFRIEVDVRWNWIAARNIGVEHAAHPWVFLTDIDHVVPLETWRAVMSDSHLDTFATYKFAREDYPHRTPYKPHPNTWMMTRKHMLQRIGGYDERFSGYYGTDGEFRDRCQRAGKGIVERSDVIVRYHRDHVPDAATNTYQRKQPEDGENVPRIRKIIAASPAPHRLTFPFHEVE